MKFKSIFLIFLFCLLTTLNADENNDNADVEVVIPGQQSENNPGPVEQSEGEKENQNPSSDVDPSYEQTSANPPVVEDAHVETNNADVEVNNSRSYVKKGRSGKYTFSYGPDYDPMESNIAPPEPDKARPDGTPYVLSATRLDEIRKKLMYPFYNKGGPTNEGDYQKYIQASSPQVHKNLNFQLPFFGFRYNYTRVSLHGYLEFSDPPPNYNYPLVFPVKGWPKINDPSFIGIFFSKCRIGNLEDEDEDRREPGVYFRLERDLRGRRDQMGIEIRERLKWDIKTGVIGSETFDPKHAVIVTWKNVSFAGGFGNSLYQTNTFQMVLATDEVYTYAIFNYLKLKWTTHTEAGGDTTLGEGGVTAFVGFNAGNGTRSYEYMPYSQASVIRDLTSTGWGNGIPGRHIFRIDENILVGSANKDIDGANLPLFFAPESGNMLGGTLVNITGPRFRFGEQIRCKFDVATIVYGEVLDYNRAVCVQPPLTVEGYVRLEIAVGKENYKWKGTYYVESPAQASQKIFFKDQSVHERYPAEIKFTWEKYNLTNNEGSPISFSLWGYRETTIRPEMIYITQLDNLQNSGEGVIVPSQYKDRDDGILTELKFGFLQMNITLDIPVEFDGQKKTVQVTRTIWSRPIPLGWFFAPQWERLYGKKWPVWLCDEWLKNDRYYSNFAHELPQCPCTLEQALADKGRYMPDFDCDKDANPQCYYNNQAVHCVRTGAPNIAVGAEQQCCYDKNKYLMLSYDQQWGSSPRRCHNLGYMPYNEATKVPTLSQWFHDMVPKYVCCLWQEEQAVGCETLRFERRPSQDCVAYQAPEVGGVYGDPHIVTFDDLEYTFNGKGEFVLVKTYNTVTDNLEVQGRFEQMDPNAYGDVKATQLTSIVARGNSSTIIEVRQRPKEARWRYHLDVLANGKRIYFDRPSLKFQHFPGVTVYTPTYVLNQSEVIMMFDNGAGVEVVENDGYMTGRVYLPWTFINKTRGLLGNWSHSKLDDFVLPDSTTPNNVVDVNNIPQIYKDFGLHWMVNDVLDPYKGKSLFHREFGRIAASYNNATFDPQFETEIEKLIPQNRSEQIKRITDYCHIRECVYDYAMTLNEHVAHFTSNYKASIFSAKEVGRKRILSCGVLETPRFGRKSTFLFVPGTTVTFECSQDFTLVGDPKRTCQSDGTWDIPEYGYTECLRSQEYSSRVAAITWGIILAVLIPIILLIGFIAFRVFQKMKNSDGDNTWKYRESTYEDEDDEDKSTKKRAFSPFSDVSSTSSGTLKKRRNYDKTYRTNEPLEGKPQTEFEQKELDPNDQDFEVQSLSSSRGSLSPTNRSSLTPTKKENTFASFKPSSPIYQEPPDVVQGKTDPNVAYTENDYALPFNKRKERYSSQSSIITDV